MADDSSILDYVFAKDAVWGMVSNPVLNQNS